MASNSSVTPEQDRRTTHPQALLPQPVAALKSINDLMPAWRLGREFVNRKMRAKGIAQKHGKRRWRVEPVREAVSARDFEVGMRFDMAIHGDVDDAQAGPVRVPLREI